MSMPNFIITMCTLMQCRFQSYTTHTKELHKIIPISQLIRDFHSILHTDASNDGVGWVLSQSGDKNSHGHPVQGAASGASLNEAQRRYSPVELELLSVVTACKN